MTCPNKATVDAIRAVLGLQPLYAADHRRSEAERFHTRAYGVGGYDGGRRIAKRDGDGQTWGRR